MDRENRRTMFVLGGLAAGFAFVYMLARRVRGAVRPEEPRVSDFGAAAAYRPRRSFVRRTAPKMELPLPPDVPQDAEPLPRPRLCGTVDLDPVNSVIADAKASGLLELPDPNAPVVSPDSELGKLLALGHDELEQAMRKLASRHPAGLSWKQYRFIRLSLGRKDGWWPYSLDAVAEIGRMFEKETRGAKDTKLETVPTSVLEIIKAYGRRRRELPWEKEWCLLVPHLGRRTASVIIDRTMKEQDGGHFRHGEKAM